MEKPTDLESLLVLTSPLVDVRSRDWPWVEVVSLALQKKAQFPTMLKLGLRKPPGRAEKKKSSVPVFVVHKGSFFFSLVPEFVPIKVVKVVHSASVGT